MHGSERRVNHSSLYFFDSWSFSLFKEVKIQLVTLISLLKLKIGVFEEKCIFLWPPQNVNMNENL